MKKIFLFMSLIMLALMMSACSGRGDVLRVGMDLSYPPFETVTTDNEPMGISVDIAKAFGLYLGREVEIINTDFGSLIPALNSGEIDIIIASMSITAERELSVDFTDPYFYFKIISLMNKTYAENNGLTEDSSVDDVLALEDVTYVGLASQVSVTIPQSYGKTVIEATDLGTAVESVAQGTADLLLMSANPVVAGYQANSDDTIVLWDAFVSSPIGMAVAEGNTELLAQANAFIDTFSDENGLYQVLKDQWDAVILAELGKYGLDFYIHE
ncbi:MAG: transporter substrate-binding domain-containing protein [Candidatus Izemoplasmatales bacterium]|nr:transporter substrate-binding domain-containing protein [Candidatus Izemoplasmatales bacterium]